MSEFQEFNQSEVGAPQGGMGLAIASLVCSLVGIVLWCFAPFGYIASLVGLVLGIVVMVKKSPGKGLALAGVICGAIALFGAIIFWILAAIGLAVLDGAGMLY